MFPAIFIKKTEEGMPDVAVTVVYEADADRTEYIYFEQDGMTATLYNWLNGRLSISQIEAIKCEIIVPEDGEEHKAI